MNIKYLLTCAMLSLALTSCRQEPLDTSTSQRGVTLSLTLPAAERAAATYSADATTDENRINTLYVKIFNGIGTQLYFKQFDNVLPGAADSLYSVNFELPAGIVTNDNLSDLRVEVQGNSENEDLMMNAYQKAPFYISGQGTIQHISADSYLSEIHLMRSVAKVRVAVRTTQATVPSDLQILGSAPGDPKLSIQFLRVPDEVGNFAPFVLHDGTPASDAIVPNSYLSGSVLDWWSSSVNNLREEVSLNGEKVMVSSVYLNENYLSDESAYNPSVNVTTLKVSIPITDGVVTRTIEREIPIRTDDSYRLRRNSVYTVDIQVTGIDRIDWNVNEYNWANQSVYTSITGGEGPILTGPVSMNLSTNITDPCYVATVNFGTFEDLISIYGGDEYGNVGTIRIPGTSEDIPVSNFIQLWYYVEKEGMKKVDMDKGFIQADLPAGQSDIKVFVTTTERTECVPCLWAGVCNIRKCVMLYLATPTVTPLDGAGPANCYIAPTTASGVYSFNAEVMGNGAAGIIDAGAFTDAYDRILTQAGGAALPATPLSARLVWQDRAGMVSQIGLKDGRVQFQLSDGTGNAVIAVCDKENPYAADAKILWSWHLWQTDTPGDILLPPATYTSWNNYVFFSGNEYTMMDRNMGATSTTVDDHNTCGLLYQWGRKDPFSGAKDFISNDETKLYDHKGDIFVLDVSKPYSYGDNSITVPDGLRQMAPENSYLWGNHELTDDNDRFSFGRIPVKTIYDPCPAGYKTAPLDMFGAFYNYYSTAVVTIETYGITLHCQNGATSFIPCAGYRTVETNKLLDRGNSAVIFPSGVLTPSPYTSQPPYIKGGFSVYLGVNPSYLVGSSERKQACSIRCMKE